MTNTGGKGMKGKAAYIKARRQYKELAKRNSAQAETIANLGATARARIEECDRREAALRDEKASIAARFGWGFWRRVAFAVTGR
jgi:phage regulator Rha-like protein